MVKTYAYEAFLYICSSRELETAKLINGAEIGDYVEQDEEIATIETDKVHFRGH